LTRLDVQIATSTSFLIGISDFRGDGRPDYRYEAKVLYADSVSPARIGVAGGPVTLSGTGFAPGMTASVGANAASVLDVTAGQMVLETPPSNDGATSITASDPVTGGSTTMTNALTYGAAASDRLLLLNGRNPSTPVGTVAPYAVIVQAVAADGVTPVAGATIAWSATNSVQLSACGGSSNCAVTTDLNGDAATWLTPTISGTATITATLAPGVYSPAQAVSAPLNATESAADIGVSPAYLWISQGATVSTPVAARVLKNGVPQKNVTVNFMVASGTGTLSTPSAVTDSNGNASVTLSVTQIAALVQISACLAPSNVPCQSIYATPVPLAQQQLQPVAGAAQVSTGEAFQPVVVRVTDSSSPPNPVLAAPVLFQTTVLRPGGSPPAPGNGETNPINPGMPVILSVTQSSATTDINGLASVVPASGGFSPPVEVNVAVSAGTTAQLNDVLEVFPALTSGSDLKVSNWCR